MDRATLKIATLLSDAPQSAALKNGTVVSPLLELDFAAIKPVHDGFASFVRDLRFDFGELAIMTFLQARAAGVPLVLLPVTLSGGCHHGSLVYNPVFGAVRPRDLCGARIGLRAYSQTTPTWVRGVLREDHGVDLRSVTWVSNEDPHVLTYRPPANVESVPRHQSPVDLLLKGDVHAAILGSDARGDPRFRCVIEDCEQQAAAWVARHGFEPINHVAVVRRSLLDAAPRVVRELHHMLVASRIAAGIPGGAELHLPVGIDAMRPALECAVHLAASQGLISTRPPVSELFAEAAALLDL